MKRFTSIVACCLPLLGLAPARAERAFNVQGVAGACRLANGVLTIHDNGKVSLTARVASSSNGSDAYCLTFQFQDGNGTQVFQWPMIRSQTLYPVWQTWARDNLAVPQNTVNVIQRISWTNHC